MSIGTDVARIKGNITAALAAIADKGVTVPDGSTSDALASLIASIEAGSSDTLLGYNLLSGTITLSKETTDLIYLVEGAGFKEAHYGFCALWNSNIKIVGTIDGSYVGSSALTGGTTFAITSKDSNAYNFKLLRPSDKGSLLLLQTNEYKLKPGDMYCWIMLYRKES